MNKTLINVEAASVYAKELTKIALEHGKIKTGSNNPKPEELADAITAFHHRVVEGLTVDIKH